MKITLLLEKKRKEQKITQKKMAKHLGIGIQSYRRRLRDGGSGFSDSEIEVMVKVLGMQIHLLSNDQVVSGSIDTGKLSVESSSARMGEGGAKTKVSYSAGQGGSLKLDRSSLPSISDFEKQLKTKKS